MSDERITGTNGQVDNSSLFGAGFEAVTPLATEKDTVDAFTPDVYAIHVEVDDEPMTAAPEAFTADLFHNDESDDADEGDDRDETKRLSDQWQTFDDLTIRARKRSVIDMFRRCLPFINKHDGLPKKTMAWRQFSRPMGPVRLNVERPELDPQDIPEADNIMHLWGPDGQVEPGPPLFDIEALWTNHTVVTKPRLTNLKTVGSTPQKPPTTYRWLEKIGNKISDLKDAMHRRQLYAGLGAVMLAGMAIFAVTNLDANPPKPQSLAADYQVSPPATVTQGLILRSPMDKVRVDRHIAHAPNLQENSTPSPTEAVPTPEPDVENVEVTIAPNGGSLWGAVSQELRDRGVEGNNNIINITAALNNSIKDMCTCDINTVYGGQKFNLPLTYINRVIAETLSQF